MEDSFDPFGDHFRRILVGFYHGKGNVIVRHIHWSYFGESGLHHDGIHALER